MRPRALSHNWERYPEELALLHVELGQLLSTYAHVIRQDDDRVRRLVDEHLGGEVDDWLITG